MRKARSWILKRLGIATFVLCILCAPTFAQGIVFGDGFVRMSNATGSTLLIDKDAALYLGGAGSSGLLILRDAAYRDTISLSGSTADQWIGGAGQDGDLSMRDDSGVFTGISIDGNEGLIWLGNPIADSPGGQLALRDSTGQIAIHLVGHLANVTNKLAGNGTIKAWARIDASGWVHSCWRCDPHQKSTKRLWEGTYRVSFSPLGPDIRSRPRLAVLDGHGTWESTGQVTLRDESPYPQVLNVLTRNSSGDAADRAFTVFVF